MRMKHEHVTENIVFFLSLIVVSIPLSATQMERWIQMHYQIREREAALQISKSRELFFWLSTFYAVSMVGMIYRFVLWPFICVTVTTIPSIDCRYKVTKRSNNLVPIVPFTFTLAYVADLAYGSKIHRIRGTYGHNSLEKWLFLSLSKRHSYENYIIGQLMKLFSIHVFSRGRYDNAEWIRPTRMATRTADRFLHRSGTRRSRNREEAASDDAIGRVAPFIVYFEH